MVPIRALPKSCRHARAQLTYSGCRRNCSRLSYRADFVNRLDALEKSASDFNLWRFHLRPFRCRHRKLVILVRFDIDVEEDPLP